MGYNTTELDYEQNKLDNLGGFTTMPSATSVNKYVNRSTYDLADSWYAKQMDKNYLNTPTGRRYPNLRPTMAATNLFAPYRPGMRGVMDDNLADRVAEQQQLGAKNVMQQKGMKPTAAQQRHIDSYWNESSFYNRRNAKGQAFDLQKPVLHESITDPNMRQFVTDTGEGMATNFNPNNMYKAATAYRYNHKDYYNMNKKANNYVPGDNPLEWAAATAGGAVVGGGLADHFNVFGGDVLKERAIGGAVGALTGASLLALATGYYKHGYRRGVASNK